MSDRLAPSRRRHVLASVLLSGAVLAGCTSVTDRTVSSLTAPRPELPWRPTAEERKEEREAVKELLPS